MNRRDLIRKSFAAALTMPLVDLAAVADGGSPVIIEIPVIQDAWLHYDLATLPGTETIESILYRAKNYGIIVFDSCKNPASIPRFVAKNESIQTSDNVVKLDIFHK